ncbi:histone H1-delta-like [Paramuricea clavata]|uniref:Histone H1-delta-like n=1 Tax=Paramuricea clavata TaxID=317549 RepID=A0A7D9K1H7_PARCT|nr:histone H1-delta-like [Paramuricea clavata]
MSSGEVQKRKTAPPAHPSYKDMIIAAITALKDRKGISRQAIVKYVLANYKVGDNAGKLINNGLKRGIASGTFELVKDNRARFKLSEATKTAEKKPAAKKPVAKKVAAKTAKPKKPTAKTTKKTTKPAKKPAKSPKKKTTKSPAKTKTKKPTGKAATKKAGAKKATPKKGVKKPAAKKATKAKK